MSLLSQLDAFIAEGKIAKAAKPRKKGKAKKPVNPNLAKKYQVSGQRLPGERFGFQENKSPPVPKPVFYKDNSCINDNKFVPTRPLSYQEEFGHENAIILNPDDIEILYEVCFSLKQKRMKTKDATQMIKLVLKDALHVDGHHLAILK